MIWQNGLAAVLTKCVKPYRAVRHRSRFVRGQNRRPVFKVYNIVNQAIAFDYRPQYVSEHTHRTILKRANALPGDVLMTLSDRHWERLRLCPNLP